MIAVVNNNMMELSLWLVLVLAPRVLRWRSLVPASSKTGICKIQFYLEAVYKEPLGR